MGIFNDRSKRALVGAMRECVCDTLMESATLTSKQATDKMNFVFENATYEQLLNITMNPSRDTNYLPAYVLEGAVALLHRACLTKRKNIGPNAITEASKLLQKETGAVITESMKTAALNSVNNGSGLKIVGKLIEEAVLLQEAGINSLIGPLQNFVAPLGASANQAYRTSYQELMNGVATAADRGRISSAITAAIRSNPDAASLTATLKAIPGIDATKVDALVSAQQQRLAYQTLPRNMLTGSLTPEQQRIVNSNSNLRKLMDNMTGLNPAKDSEQISGLIRSTRMSALDRDPAFRRQLDRIAELKNKTHLGPTERSELDRLVAQTGRARRRITGGVRNVGRSGGQVMKGINPNIFNNANREIATQSKRMNPWAAAGLGLAAAGAGALLYKRYKDNQQMQQ